MHFPWERQRVLGADAGPLPFARRAVLASPKWSWEGQAHTGTGSPSRPVPTPGTARAEVHTRGWKLLKGRTQVLTLWPGSQRPSGETGLENTGQRRES